MLKIVFVGNQQRAAYLRKKSYYRELYAGGMHLLPWNGIWRVKVPTKVVCLFVCFILSLIIIIIIFTWTTTLRRILTLAN